MGEDNRTGILRQLLAFSREQEACIKEGRLAEALDLMKRRERLAEEMKSLGIIVGEHDIKERGILAEISESDKRIRILTEERLKSVSEKLEARLKAKNVISAYIESGQDGG